ncbi:SDR family oxidoreductase [Klebsiella oxytoca]|nr:SDR family oxidoreductase [Klebsiella oxytoca]
MSEKIWFITGSSRGFGRQFTEAALQRGDKVAATARNTRGLADLVERFGDAVLPLQLDVTDRTQVFEAVAAARERFGRLDVVVNNAGYSLIGAVEDLGEQELRDQLETNVFGVLHVTQAVLPILREQRAGHIIQISTMGGIMAFPTLGAYHASKWALEGMTDALSQEVTGFGIKVTLVEPGGFATGWSGASAIVADAHPAYAPLHENMAARRAQVVLPEPVGFRSAILTVVDAEKPPLRVFFGEGPTFMAPQVYQQRLTEWAQWAHVSRAAEGK